MKTLVVFFSFSGNNKLLALEIQKLSGCDIYQIEEPEKRSGIRILFDVLFRRDPEIKRTEIQVSRYDHLILSAPIWAGRIANPLKTFLKVEKDKIREYSFITLCGAGGNKHLAEELTKVCGKRQWPLWNLPLTACCQLTRGIRSNTLPVTKYN
jgi:flavodoxin